MSRQVGTSATTEHTHRRRGISTGIKGLRAWVVFATVLALLHVQALQGCGLLCKTTGHQLRCAAPLVCSHHFRPSFRTFNSPCCHRNI